MGDNGEGEAVYEKLSQIAKAEVHAALAELPPELRGAVGAVPVFFEPAPDTQDRAAGVDPDTLGYFDEGSAEAPTPRIRLWLLNLWDYVGEDPDVFRDEVRTTLLHEIGHFLGWSEEEIEERGLG
jgi:predicted Zn-dependent protease with MMP-like domain